MNALPLTVRAGFVLIALHAASLADAAISGEPATVATFYESDDGGSAVIATVEPPAGVFNAQAGPTDSFVRFVRFPTEEKALVSMNATNPVAYYRDSLSGGETLHAGGNDGDILGAQVTPPKGTAVQFVGFRFDGGRRCWVRQQGSTDCVGGPGATTIRIAWLAGSQCGTSGDWRFEVFRNGQNIFGGQYKLIPSINPDKVSFITAPAYNQGNYSDQYGDICRDPQTGAYQTCSLITTPDPPPATIRQLGCLLTGYASALTYHGIQTLPTDLNDYLTDHEGYTGGGAIWPNKVVEYAKSRDATLKLTFVSGKGENGDVVGGIARDAVCKAGPVPLAVKHHAVGRPNGPLRGHFATAWGRPDAENTFLLKDPNGGLNNQLDSTDIPRDYSNVHQGTRALRPAPTTFVFPGGLTIALGSPAELLLTDPSGRRTGINSATDTTFEEIPGSSYMVDAIDPPDEPDAKGIDTKMLEVSPLPDGQYTLAVQGTGSGTYLLEFLYQGVDHQGQAKAAIRDVPVAAGTVHTYRFTAPIATGGGFRLEGGFNGGGQRPRDVNKFLSYAAVSSGRTDLPAGTTTYPLMVFYDAAIVPSSFYATINRTTITSLFHPAPGGFETVSIPLQKGSNTLQLSIDGNLANRVATDTDRLVFRAP